MIRLSKRMEHIVRLAEPERLEGEAYSCVAEAGCDHAYITMEIVKRGYAKKGIAMDIKEGPLSHARKNIEMEFGGSCEEKVTTRLSDGLLKLGKGEADLLVIAGMGGELICRILREGGQAAEEIPVWILQPQTEYYELRKYLEGQNRHIVSEDMVLEDGKFYPMFRVTKGDEIHNEDIENSKKFQISFDRERYNLYHELSLKYGPLLLKEKNPCLLKYLLWEEGINRKLYKSLEGEDSDKAMERKRELNEEYLKIQEAKGFFD